ncbi:MAG: cache domain-containing protein [Arcobacter sp.]|uniref:sensor histidine kinase n=1 Tax=Arcobacter sp. TaxID=1872629 RepID=UPI003CFE65B9
MLTKKEKKLIKLIKYTPIFIVALVCMIIISLLYIDKNITLKSDLKALENDYLKRNQNIIKDEVNKIYDYIIHKKLNSEKELKQDIKSRVLAIHNMMTYIYEKYKDKESAEQIQTRIKDALKALRFNDNRGYFYINTMEGKSILHPLYPQFENKSILDFEDNYGSKFIENVINDLKIKKESYNEYYWKKPEAFNKLKQYKKITFNKVFEPYNWYIGTGEYLEDFEEKIKKEILEYISSIKYSKNGYIFVIDEKGVYLTHIEKSYIGVNRITLKDANGFMITKEIMNLGNKGEGFLKYVGTIKPDTKLPSEKITFVKGFKDWDWAIATGFYTDELAEQIKTKQYEYKQNYLHNLLSLFTVSGLITIVFLFLSFYISKRLERRFYKYKQQVLSYIKKSREKDNLLAQQSKMAAMGEMLENIAHQWRQPLSSISTLSTGIKLQYQYGEINKEEILRSMDAITTTTKYLSQTIDDFRDYFNPNKEAYYFNLKKVFQKAFDLLEIQFNLRNIIFIKNLDDVYIYGFENEFLQVIINILNNAKDEFEKKELNQKYIFVDIRKEENRVKIFIKDNAGGIAENILEKVFEPYFTTKFKSQGTGIGLYMSKEIIEKHMKGRISVYNEDYIYENSGHKGAVFEIIFLAEEAKKVI